jgi:lipopolysaccharide/colanic/teichoic acid biosynthesis glycosyltransferase
MTHPVMKRAYDVSFAALGLAILSPVLDVIALAVKLSDFGPVLFLQERIGQFGRTFRIWKFRTMIVDAEKFGLSITKRGDRRVTRIGRILRATKLDELPQLWNVLRGDMSLVGPRPEVPRYVARYTAEQRRVLELKPGMTDVASLAFRHEERMLGCAQDPEQFYLECCLPRKIEMNLGYSRQANLLRDTWVILRTLSPFQFVQGPLHQAEPARGRG